MQSDELVAIEAASVMFNIGSTWKSSSRADAAFSIKWIVRKERRPLHRKWATSAADG
jgi:hypothetical protein